MQDATVLAERHAVQDAEYRTIVAVSEEEGGRTAERVALHFTCQRGSGSKRAAGESEAERRLSEHQK